MNRGFYTSIAGLNTQQARMQVISNNIANSSTSGFKRSTAVVSPFHEMLLYNTGSQPNSSIEQKVGNLHLGSKVSEVVSDLSPGLLVKTEKNVNLALAGEGFFRLEDLEGNHFFTRDGNFYIDSSGYLTHSSGMHLSGEGGPVKIDKQEFTVSENGEILSNGNVIDRLFISRFEDSSALYKNDKGLFTAPDGIEALDVEEPEVRQGYIEESNVDPTVEMVSAMEILRAYSAGHKMAQAHDKLQDLLVREIGRVK